MQDIDGAIANYGESVELLAKLSDRDAEVHSNSIRFSLISEVHRRERGVEYIL